MFDMFVGYGEVKETEKCFSKALCHVGYFVL
jgi:hypothetical protein